MPLVGAAVCRKDYSACVVSAVLLVVVLSRICVVRSWKLPSRPGRSAENCSRRLFAAGGAAQAPQPRRQRTPKDIARLEAQWQRLWEDNNVFRAEEPGDCRGSPAAAPVSGGSGLQGCGEGSAPGDAGRRPKFYGLCMIPYPSGDGLHVGHLLGYTVLDVVCRYKRMLGYRVLCPIGWDSFGLPAERYAESVGRDVRDVSRENIENFRRQLKRMGFAYDWSRELATSDPSYYRWTQWMFQRFYQRGIAYRATQVVNWCPALGSVLANEEVRGGLSERGGFPVYRRGMEQWLLRITDYARRLSEGLDGLEWPAAIVDAQKKWINVEQGYKVTFRLDDGGRSGVALYGFETDIRRLEDVEHVEVAVDMENLFDFVSPSAVGEVSRLVELTAKKSNLERYDNQVVVESGIFVVNPVTGRLIKVYVTNRPLLFSQPINCRIVTGSRKVEVEGVLGDTGTSSGNANPNVPGVEPFVNMKLRDWVFSRQRYWGEPIPMERRGESYVPVDETMLPIETGPGQRETMPQWAGSSWHYLRFCDPKNAHVPFDISKAKSWMPVDLYVGGAEHAVSHLLYARFWNKVLYDMGVSPVEEPFKRILLHGIMRNASFRVDGKPVDTQLVVKYKGKHVMKEDMATEVEVKLEKMSKSKGNVVCPDAIIDRYGADALRLHLLFLGPLGKDRVWSDQGLVGVSKLLNRLDRFFRGVTIAEEVQQVDNVVKQLVDKIAWDIENNHLNVAVSDFFKFTPHLQKLPICGKLGRNVANVVLKLLAPFAPHIAEDLWHVVNPDFGGSMANQPWPTSENMSRL
ncbi:Leucine-tRNA ligase [Babesia caballi]|uniref:leucine--tRNA ligase n=1 Tax=Babesia caballi TaxID=5871 RepID=A0AAV4LXI0_BABCB|nr:Leucine-tRNA ligase [Babesia caballi]